jgi:hypothetical protein
LFRSERETKVTDSRKLASTAGFNEMTETWCVLDLDTPVVRRNATLYGRLVEYEEPSQAIAHFAEIGKRSHVSRIRRCEGIESAGDPSDAHVVPNPNFGTMGCSWELICAADGLPLPAVEPLLRSVSPSSVVCVALRWHRQGVRIHGNAVEEGRYVSALLLKFSRAPTSSLPQELLEVADSQRKFASNAASSSRGTTDVLPTALPVSELPFARLAANSFKSRIWRNGTFSDATKPGRTPRQNTGPTANSLGP